MAIVSKTNRDGVDVVIENLQQAFYPSLIGYWDVDAVYTSYPRANKNYREDNIIPEISLDQKNYQEVLMTDKFSVTSFWLNNDSRVYQDDNSQIKQSISIIFQADLVKLYGSTERLDEQFNMDVLRVLKAESKFVVGDITIDEGIDNVYNGLSLSGELKNQIKTTDMSKFHVVRFTFDVLYKDNCNRPIVKSCPGVSISVDGVFSEVVAGGGSYNCIQGGDPVANTMNGVSLTDAVAGTTKTFTITYANGDPVVVTTNSDSATAYDGSVPNSVTDIAYVRTAWTARNTNFNTHDLGWYLANEPSVFAYNVNGITPILDPSDSTKLLTNNAFSNLNRVTNSLGLTATYDGTGGEIADYAIDHFTGQGYYLQNAVTTNVDFVDSATTLRAATLAGFSDWRMLTMMDIALIIQDDSASPSTIFSAIENWSTDLSWIMNSTGTGTGYFWRLNQHMGASLYMNTRSITSPNASIMTIATRNHY